MLLHDLQHYCELCGPAKYCFTRAKEDQILSISLAFTSLNPRQNTNEYID